MTTTLPQTQLGTWTFVLIRDVGFDLWPMADGALFGEHGPAVLNWRTPTGRASATQPVRVTTLRHIIDTMCSDTVSMRWESGGPATASDGVHTDWLCRTCDEPMVEYVMDHDVIHTEGHCLDCGAREVWTLVESPFDQRNELGGQPMTTRWQTAGWDFALSLGPDPDTYTPDPIDAYIALLRDGNALVQWMGIDSGPAGSVTMGPMLELIEQYGRRNLGTRITWITAGTTGAAEVARTCTDARCLNCGTQMVEVTMDHAVIRTEGHCPGCRNREVWTPTQ